MAEQSFWVLWVRVTIAIAVAIAMSLRYWFHTKAHNEKPEKKTPRLWVSQPAIWMQFLFQTIVVCVLVFPGFFVEKGLVFQAGFPSFTHILGTLMIVIALGLFYSVHVTLGNMWNINVSVKKGHKIIDVGPYRFVRHPMYVTYFFAFWGAIFLLQSIYLAILFIPYFCAYYFMASHEEILFVNHFGQPYKNYMKKAGMFLPILGSFKPEKKGKKRK